MITKLEAVQQALRLQGFRPAGSLDTANTAPTIMQQMEDVLDELDKEIQSRGWHENTEIDVELTPDPQTDKIAVDPDVLHIDTSVSALTIDVVQRGGFLYDRDDNTFAFTVTTLKVNLTRQLKFPDLSFALASYIVVRAAQRYNDRYQNNNRKREANTKSLAVEEARRYADLMRQEINATDTNIFNKESSRRVLGDRNRRYHFLRTR